MYSAVYLIFIFIYCLISDKIKCESENMYTAEDFSNMWSDFKTSMRVLGDALLFLI